MNSETLSFSSEQSWKYFAYRLPEERLPRSGQANVKCPFHQDSRPSMSLNFEKGVWKCHTCEAGGGLYDFEKHMFPGRGPEELWAEIYRITGMEPPKFHRRLVATYGYRDEDGKLLFEKLRFDPKEFSQRQPDGKGGWVYNLRGVRKVLYNLPRVIVSRYVIIVEGEKDADNLQAALDAAGLKDIAVTTCFGGAGSWRAEYGLFFTGRSVLILPDNDSKGRSYALKAAENVREYTPKVKIVELPQLPEKGDVSQWLAAGHQVAELLELAKETPVWAPAPVDHQMLTETLEFLEQDRPEIEWLVEGLIPAGTRGLLVGGPKDGKTILSLDLGMALVTGSSWLGHGVPQRRRVAVISREDAPRETARRLYTLTKGSAGRGNEILRGSMWVNTMDQCMTLFLDNEEQLSALIKELRTEMLDLVIFDVFRDLHTQDENDNTAMAVVLAALKRIQVECMCAVLVLHHVRKDLDPNVFRSSRGASAIHGWTEYGIGVSVVDESLPRKDWVRKVEFELKCAMPADPVWFKISGEEGKTLRVELTEKPPSPRKRAHKVQEIYTGHDQRRAPAGDQGGE